MNMKMQRSSLVLMAGIATAIGLTIAYGDNTPAASASPITATNTLPSAGAVELPPNHPTIAPRETPHNPVHGFAAVGGEHELTAIAWKAPPTWSPAPNPNAMRLATYKLPSPQDADVELVVSRAGGDVASNVTRWAGQFGSATPKQTKKTIHELAVTIVDIEGTYDGHDHSAMLGAIVETKGQPYFFKVVGPAATVRAARPAFDAMIESITPN